MEIINDLFIVKEIDMVPLDPSRPSVKVKHKIFPKVSRIYAISETKKLEFILDINTDIYKISLGDRLEFLIIGESLQAPTQINKEIFSSEWVSNLKKDLISDYEYVMYGIIFHSGIEKDRTFFYASFGGLLLKMFGVLDKKSSDSLNTDLNILLLLNKKLRIDF
mmetsp:Transcript_529/g.1246  ORF Transcript_529/g.1246 Transcript_529/m.1246 type:complete len:164 (-) Transcript_529:1808-2299(-)